MMTPAKTEGTKEPGSQLRSSTAVATLLEPLLAVHGASDVSWLADATMTAAERGVGALYGFLFLGAETGVLRGEEPASRERLGAAARVAQVLGEDLTRLAVDPDSSPLFSGALEEGRIVATERLKDALPFLSDEERVGRAQRSLGVSEVWIVPVAANNETLGAIILLMPEDHHAVPEVAEGLGRHVAVALANLREGDAARKRGDIDIVRWIHDERRFIEELGIELQRAARHNRPVSVLVVRVDNYAQLRQRLGRFLAERALRRVAATMEDAMRATDFLGAYGADGFAAILVEADAIAAENAKARYSATLGKLDTAQSNVPGFDLHFSFAVATMKEGGSTAEELLAIANEQLNSQTPAQNQAA